MKITYTLAAIVLIALFVQGCSSTSTITEFDAQGKITKVTDTKESVVEQVIASTKEKTVFIFDKGWWFGAEASIFSPESPVPITRILAKKNNRGVLSIRQDQRGMAEIRDIVKAALETESLAVTASGVTSSGTSEPASTAK
ncbi:MAG: hypothetical protein A2020_07960 [Lentisphaerae bacterium GWF2_45_14]|nr:MAG: hypothetical protein A2020_07960 [Lentisphaerae bacterium GWF2_45_14]